MTTTTEGRSSESVERFGYRHVEFDPWRHVAAPAAGAVIIGYVMIKADVAAKTVGLIWLGTGLVVLAAFHFTGRAPSLAGMEETP